MNQKGCSNRFLEADGPRLQLGRRSQGLRLNPELVVAYLLLCDNQPNA
jgi:hypothetical protein